MGYLYRFAYIQSFLLKKREQITLLLFFSRPRLLFFFLHHRKKSKQNKQLLMICAAQEHNTKREKKTAAQKFLSSASYLRPKFLECICLEKNTKVLSSRHSVHVKENERNGQDYQKYALFVPFLRLFFSPSLSLSFVPKSCAFFAFVFFLSLLSKCVCACVCARVSLCLERPDLRLGVLFPSQPQVFFSCTHVLTFPLFIIASSFHSVCCIGAGYVGGPTMAMIALKCPHIEVIL